jgi:uncharacterized protein YbdZ (MbtH family)
MSHFGKDVCNVLCCRDKFGLYKMSLMQYITDNHITRLLSKNHEGTRHSLVQMYKMDLYQSRKIGHKQKSRQMCQQHCLTNWTAGAASLSGPETLPHQLDCRCCPAKRARNTASPIGLPVLPR